MTEVVRVLGAMVSVAVCCSQLSPLFRALTRYIARKPLDLRVGRAAHAHLIGLTCELEDPRAYERAQVSTSNAGVAS